MMTAMNQCRFEVVDEDSVRTFREFFVGDIRIVIQSLLLVGYLLIRWPGGFGKTHFVAEPVLESAETYKHFDLLVYAPSQKKIIAALGIVNHQRNAPVGFHVLEARPAWRCEQAGKNDEFERMEAANLGAFARTEKLCPSCILRNECNWPMPLREKLAGVGLVICTSERFFNDRQFLNKLKQATGAKKVGIIFDEAGLVEKSFKQVIRKRDIELLSQVISLAARDHALPCATTNRWQDELRCLLTGDIQAVQGGAWDSFRSLPSRAGVLQRYGHERYQTNDRFIGFVLGELANSRKNDRWINTNGDIEFISYPNLAGACILFLGANLEGSYIEHKLNIHPVVSPYENFIAIHRDTRVFVVHDSRYNKGFFKKNWPQTLGLPAAIIRSNIAQNLTTMLIASDRLILDCTEKLSGLLGDQEVSFVHDDFENLGAPSPRIIPIVHYGIEGTNLFEWYKWCICLNAYYLDDKVLLGLVNETLPPHLRIPLRVVHDGGQRRIEAIDPAYRGMAIEALANQVMRHHETKAVIQAILRPRPNIHPRNIIICQRNDFTKDLGPYQPFKGIDSLRGEFGMSKLQLENKVAQELMQLRQLGYTRRQAAKALGIGREKARLLVNKSESAFGK